MDDARANIEKVPAVDADSIFAPEIMAELEDAVADLIKGVRDPKKVERAARELDEGREEIRQRVGDLDLAVKLVRETRDE